MVKRSIEQNIRIKNFEARNGNYETNAVVKNQGTKQRVQRFLGDCWQWETNGQCVKGNNCSFRHDMDKRGKISQSNPFPSTFMQQNERKASRTRSPRGKSPSGRMSRWPCKDYFRGTCNNSFCERWHPPECLYYKTKSGCRFGEKCSFAHRQVDAQPTKWSKSNNDKSAVAILKKGDWHERESVTDRYHDRSGKRNDDIQEFDSKWDGILLSMTKIPSDDILEGLYKLRIRVSEKLKNVLELYDLDIHQKKAGPDYHRLKTMVKRSIEQEIRKRNFEARNGKF